MPSFIIALLKNWKAIAIVAFALLIGGLIFYQSHSIKNLKRERDEIKQELDTTRENLETMQTVFNAQREAVLKNIKAERENNEKQSTLKQKLLKSKDSDDGPVARVLRDALNGLQ